MKKRKKGRTLAKTSKQQKALLVSLSRALIEHGQIKTTLARAKELRRFIEPHITKTKKGNLSARRQLATLYDTEYIQKLTNELGPRYKDRPGGYTRIIKLGPRSSDGAEMALIQLV